MSIPRPEHPNPQFERETWLNLNGEWEFFNDRARSGRDRKLYESDEAFPQIITVPFCPQSRLSGIADTDFMYSVWYRRKVALTAEQLSGGVLLHFGACDYRTFVWVNGEKVGEHRGGYVSFAFDITGYLNEGKNVIVVNAEDDERDPMIPRGKQSEEYYSHGCDYTRTTGIWQTVWLEFVPDTRIEKIKLYPDINGAVTLNAALKGAGTLTARAYYEGRPVGEALVGSHGGEVSLHIGLSETHLWEAGHGRLYDLELTYGEDKVKSYFGLRSLRLDGYKFLINEKSVFQRLVLDQSFNPAGLYTAPTDEFLKGDIDRSMAMGFNGARLHEKIFEPRFLCHADKMGYLVWGEYPNWGLDHTRPDSVYPILYEWLEEVERDFNHPSIVGWCPFNETWDRDGRKQCDEVLRTVYRVTKAVDPTRPCIDVSGGYHIETDIYDVHDYEQDPAVYKPRYDKLMETGELYDRLGERQHYTPGQPTFVSEYGGIRRGEGDGWGYGNAPKTEEEFIARYKGLTEALLFNDRFFGFCYTQLTDVEQEQNGLYTYDRKPKFDPETIRAINAQKAAIEE
ncbi:MAG: beta-galactosidase [Clostridia bacterium]|nr:beta-galactosidase [Clostridia bacterium]